MSKTKNWCFTLNNYTDQDLDDIASWEVRYIKYGKEKCPTTGTPHLQGFVVMACDCRLSKMRKICPRAHWEPMKGRLEHNDAYCEKEGDWTERGTKPMSQKRKGEVESERWDLALNAAKEGRFEEIPSDIRIKYERNLDYIRKKYQDKVPCLEGELQHEWIWGASGAGKSTKAFAENPDAYLKSANKWWDGYVDQETVICDDIDPSHKVLAHHIKLWGQHQPFPAETKGSTICIRPKKIVITSQYRIDEVFESEKDREAMHRRFTEIYVPSNRNITDTEYMC